MRPLPPVFLGLLGVLTIRAAAETLTIDPDHSSVTFTSHLLGHAVPGNFSRFSGTISVDRAHPDQLKARARIEAASLSTRNPERDHHLQSADYFDVARFPALTFQSQSVRGNPTGDFDLVGDLTIKDVTQTVVLHVHPVPVGSGPARWEAKAEVNRRDFGVAHAAFSDRAIGNPVQITLEIQAR